MNSKLDDDLATVRAALRRAYPADGITDATLLVQAEIALTRLEARLMEATAAPHTVPDPP